ncbi:hypothetical protein Arub01_34380 [Actinomadura rubrobrunea]|uniref:Uncharacterized protein n=1 Tax=Actinomadura rubrobrunea TaxID=115335 RepID=A0A9W6UVL8_9ACTN|nr:hypothetical protein Arub01_34380 [Actinomadura rubrobrunea]
MLAYPPAIRQTWTSCRNGTVPTLSQCDVGLSRCVTKSLAGVGRRWGVEDGLQEGVHGGLAGAGGPAAQAAGAEEVGAGAVAEVDGEEADGGEGACRMSPQGSAFEPQAADACGLVEPGAQGAHAAVRPMRASRLHPSLGWAHDGRTGRRSLAPSLRKTASHGVQSRAVSARLSRATDC